MIEERNSARAISVLPRRGGAEDEASTCGPSIRAESIRGKSFGASSIGLEATYGERLRHILVGLDLVAVVSIWFTCILFHPNTDPLLRATAVMAAATTTLIGLRAAGLYQAKVCAVRSSETVRVTVVTLLGGGVFGGLESALGIRTTAHVVVVALETAAAVVVLRWCFVRWLRARRAEGRSLRTVILVGTNQDAIELWTTLTSEPELGYRVGAVLGPGRVDAPWVDLPGSDAIGDLAALAGQVGANGVILVASALGDDGRVALRAAFEGGLHVQIWAGLAVDSRRLRMTPTSGVPLLYVEPNRSPLASRWALRAKRALDILGAAVIGLATAPIMAVAALLIKLEDGGPVIYRAERVGQFDVPFTVFKLRTMVPDAAQLLAEVALLNERTDGPLFKAEHDPRITRIGRLLRASSVDELPQLWNVLNGTMSLVGPRPALPTEVESFDDELRRRHQVRPGITGPWQLEARDNPSFNAYRRYDLAYVDSWSLGWDLSILCSTVEAVVARGVRPLLHSTRGRRR